VQAENPKRQKPKRQKDHSMKKKTAAQASPEKAEPKQTRIIIKPPNFGKACFHIQGLTPLYIHRFSQKVLDKLRELPDPNTGEKAPSKGTRKKEPNIPEEVRYHDARYITKEGWDGFVCSAIRNCMISACRVANFKMTVAKLSLFCIPDGFDEKQPQFQLVRIYGTPEKAVDMGRVSNGNPYPIVRPMYWPWMAKVKIRWDADQFHLDDVANLLSRAGLQVGIGEGRWDSKDSAGQGWGQFELMNEGELIS
jgi:hypothetical protein